MKKILYMCCFVIGSMVITGCTKEEMKLKQSEYTIEYGENIDNDVKTYLDNSDDYLKETKISGIPKNEKEKQYPAIGEYELTLKNGDQESKVKITVTDTVAPSFKDIKESYEVAYGKKFDVKNIKAEDLSTIEFTLDDSKVNYKKAGTYDATVIAKDSSDNEAKQNIKIKVKEEEKKETSKSTNKSNSNTSSKSSKKSSPSSKKSSSSSSSKSNSSKSSGSGGSNSSSSSGSSSNEITAEWDKDSYIEFNGGGNWAIGSEEFEWPSDWE